jgi:enoyl-CoA hydratase
MDYTGYQALKFEREGSVLTVTLSNPEARNAVNGTMHDELSRVFYDIGKDPTVRVVVLRGDPAGKAFCAGGDLRWLQEQARNPEGYAEILRQGVEIVRSLVMAPQPVVAMVDGPAIGLGATLAVCSDLCFASTEARIADPHVGVGVVAGDGGAVMWPLLVGPQRAKEYLMTGQSLTGSEAERLGLVNRAVAPHELEAETYRMARHLAEGPVLAIQWTKRAVNLTILPLLDSWLTASLALEGLTFQTADHRSATEAFLQKMPRRWSPPSPASPGGRET